jgi:hypothetical protein
MRAIILALAGGLALAASAQAAGLAPPLTPTELRAASPLELATEGCGWGWHRAHWQDHWGYWHWHCVSYGHAYHHGRTRLEHPYAGWREPTGGWGNP